ncbi:cryptochrome/photolyase family protein [Caulobacter sp. KR2-114]|uniref:cryptochrome/photolyase family protein n=1 Tax=Caulobacter sp. KR2-114 TaxID=3400912 RepID=UPI003C0AB147
MGTEAPAIVWFRQDLRLTDNPALAAAHATGRPVVPLYVLDETPGLRAMGAASRWWLDKSLAALAEDLKRLGSRLVLRRGEAQTVLRRLARETGAEAVFWNRVYDGAGVARDTAVKAALRDDGLACESFNAGLLNEPWQVKTGAGGPFKVFTPYWRAARAMIDQPEPSPRPRRLATPDDWPPTRRLASWRLHPRKPDWSGGFGDWTPGEAGARRRLDAFLDGPARDYAEGRDFPARAAISRLSAHLHFGEIGPRQVWVAVQAAVARDALSEDQAEAFLRELGWREFNHHLLFHNPRIETENFAGGFDGFPWRQDAEALEAWRRGQTGYPIVDAGLRELWTTGWMHNRVRMIVASFLVKHLLIDWREGEAWFWDTLVDADLANNVCNWQWVAGSGADAAPFFRIFNPILQGERFDADGAYVRRWVPELAKLPAKLIHQPWTADPALLRAAGVALGQTYPKPIVGHARARERALQAYQALAE